MLKKFFLNMLSSFVGTWIALVLFGVVAVLVTIGLLAKFGLSNSENVSINKGSVLTINLSGSIVERETPAAPDYMSLVIQNEAPKVQTLLELKSAISAASNNKNVAGIYLKCNGVSASLATLNALRQSLMEFRESGKPIIAYGENFSMGDYFIATAADHIYMNPYGSVTLKGVGGSVLYYKGLLDKIGVNMQVVKVGTYKSAVEPYILPEMSKPARAQLDTLYGNIWSYIKNDIASRRNLSNGDYIDSLVNHEFISLKEGEADITAGLVDALYFERSMDSIIAATVNVDKEDLNFIAPSLLTEQEDFAMAFSSKNQIAVLFASGEIIDGGGNSCIDYNILVPVINQLAEDENVKGLVLRVNSPGGSVFGSEQIGDALDYFQSKGKILAVSMGDYAASGGYWISSCADRIFADQLTITGSIGIFGLIPDLSPLLKKIGVSPQLVSTNPEASFPMIMEPMTERQHAAMQTMIEKGYDKFVARVARGRHLSEQRVRQIGEGRVWDATKAKEIGLVDEFGGLNEAIEWVAGKLEVDNYGTPYYPTVEPSIWNYIYQFGNVKLSEIVKEKLGIGFSDRFYDKFTLMLQEPSVNAKMQEMQIFFGEGREGIFSTETYK